MAVETFMKSGLLSLDEMVSALRAQSKDLKAQPVFSDSEIKLAIRQAIINSHGKYFATDTTTVDITSGNFGPYTLPAACHRIVLVTRERAGLDENPHALSSTSFDSVISSYRHFRRRGSNQLYLTKDYRDCTLTVWYETDIAVPIDNKTAGASHTNSVTTLTLVDADPQITTDLEVPAYFKWESEIVKVSAVTSNTAATMSRGSLSSTAASHASGTELSQLILADSDRAYNFIMQEAGRLLNEWRTQAGTQNVSVAANITAARFFKENRDAILREIPQTRRSRRMKFSRTRRPRRELI